MDDSRWKDIRRGSAAGVGDSGPIAEDSESESSACAVGDEPNDAIPCVWVFLPLPHPLGLPDGWSSEWPEVVGYSTVHGSVRGGRPNLLTVHQVKLGDFAMGPIAALWGFAAATITGSKWEALDAATLQATADGGGADVESLAPFMTVAEVVFPQVIQSGHEVDQLIREALEHVRHVQRSYALVASRPVLLAHRSTLPPTVPVFYGAISARDERMHVEGAIPQRVSGGAPPGSFGIRAEPLGEADLVRLQIALDMMSRGTAFASFADLRREAVALATYGGGSRMAVVALAAAGEVLLDTTLLHMMWEERVSPSEASAVFDRGVGHTARVGKTFPSRIGGCWDVGCKSAGGAYLRDLVRLRHRVVHAGDEPTDDELKGALRALADLEHYLGDLLAADRNRNRYPRTAWAFMGEEGLERRGKLTSKLRRLIGESKEPWIETFGRWRFHVQRALATGVEEPGSGSPLFLSFDLARDGRIRAVVVDPSTAHAAVVADPLHVRSDHELVQIRADLKSRQRDGEPVAPRHFELLTDRVPDGLLWRPDFEVFEDLSIYPAG